MNSSNEFAGKRHAIRPRVTRAATAALLATAAAFSLAACSSPASTSSEPSAAASPTATAQDPAGTYTKLTIDPNSPAYTPIPELVPIVTANGWTAEDVVAGQRFAVDFVVNEYLDSSALETGDEGYKAWFANEGKKYLSDDLRAVLTESTPVVIGNNGGKLKIPELFKDGTPRFQNLNLTVSNVYNEDRGEFKRITYFIEYSGNYRTTDADAAKVMSAHSIKNLPVEKQLTPEQFLASDLATPALKDGEGVNDLRASGELTISIMKNADGEFVIDGWWNKSGFGYDAFTPNLGYFTGS